MGTGFQRIFLIFANEDGGYEAGQKPSGYVKIETRDGMGKGSLTVQNLRPGNGRFLYRLYLIKNAADWKAVAVGELAAGFSRTELDWSFDPLDVGGSGTAIGEFDIAAVLAEHPGNPLDRVICPLAAYKGKKAEWRNGFRSWVKQNRMDEAVVALQDHAVKPSQAIPDRQEPMQPQVRPAGEAGMNPLPEPYPQPYPQRNIYQQYGNEVYEISPQGNIPQEFYPQVNYPQTAYSQGLYPQANYPQGNNIQEYGKMPIQLGTELETQPEAETEIETKQEYPLKDFDAQITWQGESPGENAEENAEENPEGYLEKGMGEKPGVYQEEYPEKVMGENLEEYPEKSPGENLEEYLKDNQEESQQGAPEAENAQEPGKKQAMPYQPEMDHIDTGCVYLNGNMCNAFVNNGSSAINPCTACHMHHGRPAYTEPPAGDVVMLREELDRYFEQCDPFHSHRSDYTWWRVGNPVNLNNLLYQCNIRSPLLFNPAVMMAHYKYRHLIVGIFLHKSRDRRYVVCGVPGMSMVDKKPFGDMSRWVQAEGNRPRYGAFGYWLVYIDPDGGKILDVSQS